VRKLIETLALLSIQRNRRREDEVGKFILFEIQSSSTMILSNDEKYPR
jgi:hypothetical protein